jgi:hypothetical protein
MTKHCAALLIVICGFGFFACKKGEEAKPAEKIIRPLVDSAWTLGRNLIATKTATQATAREFGYEFTADKNGKITQFGLMTPENIKYVISVWDGDSRELIARDTLERNAESPLTDFIYEPTKEIPIVAGKKYMVSMNTQNRPYYIIEPANGGFLPRKSNSITLEQFRVGPSATVGVFPSILVNEYLIGFFDIVFVPD